MERRTLLLRYISRKSKVITELKKNKHELNKHNALSLQITMDNYGGDESEEKNPYPANDYIGNPHTRCMLCVYAGRIRLDENLL